MTPDGSTLLFRRAGKRISRVELRRFTSLLQAEVAEGRPFSCLLTDDRELERLNREFLVHDYATDVLSFPSPDGDTLGDIAISVDRAGAQARQFGHSIDEEVKILMLHGVLHLLGMDHETDRGAMKRSEIRWRRKLSLPAVLTERVHA